MAEIEPTVRIKSIKVLGLFGLYDHHVTLKEERITVIHGPNGVGKTAFLKLTNAFLKGRYVEIVRVPFRSFEILFDEGSVAGIYVEEPEAGGQRKFKITLERSSQAADSVELDNEILNVQRIAEQISADSAYLTQVGPSQWVDRRTDEVLSAEDVIARSGEVSPKDAKKFLAKEPKGLRELRSRVSVHLIETQRLIRFAGPSNEWRYRGMSDRSSTTTVQEYAKDLKRQLETTLANYAKISQKLDQSFPQRLLTGSNGPVSIERLKDEMQEVEATRNKLKKIGILDRGDLAPDAYPLEISQLDSLEPTQLSVMAVYARDTKEKLQVLEELSGRIEILLGVLSRKFINKNVTISRETGLAITGPNGKPIPVTALSSGEQHELVLLYDLLFKVKQNTLVLIDEPELSLHISWQTGFMGDLLEIIRLAQFDVLMATHSPYIVGERSDLLVVLSPDIDK